MSSESVTPIGIPIPTLISRVIFSVASSMTKITPLYDPTYNVPFPADAAGLAVGRVCPWSGGTDDATAASTAEARTRRFIVFTER